MEGFSVLKKSSLIITQLPYPFTAFHFTGISRSKNTIGIRLAIDPSNLTGQHAPE